MDKRGTRPPGERDGDRTRRRVLETIGAVSVTAGLGSGMTAAHPESSAGGGPAEGAAAENLPGGHATRGSHTGSPADHEIDSCTTITSPGTYDVVADVAATGGGVCIDVRADDVTVRGNGHTLDGDGSGVAVAANFEATAGGTLTGQENVVVEDLSVTGFDTAIRYEEIAGGRIENVTARTNGTAVSFRYGVVDVTVRNSTLTDSAVGFGTLGDPDVFGGPGGNLIEYTDVESNDVGIDLGHETTGHEFVCNRIVDNGGGAVHRPVGTRGITYERNVICANPDYGIRNVDSPPEDGIPAFEDVVDATNNYWGATTGPSSVGDPATPYADPVTGALADGDGDGVSESLDPGVANVHFDPFDESAPCNVGRR